MNPHESKLIGDSDMYLVMRVSGSGSLATQRILGSFHSVSKAAYKADNYGPTGEKHLNQVYIILRDNDHKPRALEAYFHGQETD